MTVRLLVVVLSLVFSASAYAGAVGYADMEFALASTKAGKRAKRKIDKELTKRRTRLDKMRTAILKLEEDFKKQELALSAKSKEKKREEYLKKVEELRQQVAKNQREMQRTEQKIATPILKKMSEVLKKLSKKKGYTMVITKSALLHAEPKDDLTNALIKEFDRVYKGK